MSVSHSLFIGVALQIFVDFHRESDLANRGYYLIAQELVYQWLGSWVTPAWWSDAHVNKAIAGFLAAATANEVTLIENLNFCLISKERNSWKCSKCPPKLFEDLETFLRFELLFHKIGKIKVF